VEAGSPPQLISRCSHKGYSYRTYPYRGYSYGGWWLCRLAAPLSWFPGIPIEGILTEGIPIGGVPIGPNPIEAGRNMEAGGHPHLISQYSYRGYPYRGYSYGD
jgi:hypothetical protein